MPDIAFEVTRSDFGAVDIACFALTTISSEKLVPRSGPLLASAWSVMKYRHYQEAAFNPMDYGISSRVKVRAHRIFYR